MTDPRASSPRLADLPASTAPGGGVVAEAATRRARMRGLSKLDALPRGEALHIPRCRSVHTFGMRFALDLIWLRADGSVARIDRDVTARRLRNCLAARSVLECNAGEAGAFAPGPASPAA